MNGELITSVADGIGQITFSHPKANSLTLELLTRLAGAIDTLGADGAVKVILIRSTGDGSFCAGASFDEFKRISTPAEGEKFFMGFANIILAVRRVPKLVVTRVQGKVVGGGLGLVAASDYTIAAPLASGRLSEFELGIGPFTIGPAVERKIGAAAFAAMSIDCEWRDAEWLYARGLYSALASDPADLDAKVGALTARLAAASSQAAVELKQMFWGDSSAWKSLLAERARISGKLICDRQK